MRGHFNFHTQHLINEWATVWPFALEMKGDGKRKMSDNQPCPKAPTDQETFLLFPPTLGIAPFSFSVLRGFEFHLGSNFLMIFYLEKKLLSQIIVSLGLISLALVSFTLPLYLPLKTTQNT